MTRWCGPGRDGCLRRTPMAPSSRPRIAKPLAYCPADVLAVTRSHVPEALVGSKTGSDIAGLAADLPPIFNLVGFECRLAAADDRVDFGVCIERGCGDRASLADLVRTDEVGFARSAEPLLRLWVASDTAVHRYVPSVWLEWDISRDVVGPFAFASVEPTFPNVRGVPLQAELRRSVCTELVAALLPRLLTHDLLDTIDRAAEALYPTGRLLHLACIGHRDSDRVRLHFVMSSREVEYWLDRVGWPGSVDGARTALALFESGAVMVGVQIEASGEAIGPYLGHRALFDDEAPRTRMACCLRQLVGCWRGISPKGTCPPSVVRRHARRASRRAVPRPDPAEVLCEGRAPPGRRVGVQGLPDDSSSPHTVLISPIRSVANRAAHLVHGSSGCCYRRQLGCGTARTVQAGPCC